MKSLVDLGFKSIIVVNDGSSENYNTVFDEIVKFDEVILLKHYANQGKGRALKTAFNFYLNEIFEKPQMKGKGIVTADADGQHSPEDTFRVAKELITSDGKLVLGSRDFNEKIVPFKSRYGNKVTSIVFKLLFGGKILKDTQTGLRGIPNNQIIDYLGIEGERFEYEINMLIVASKKHLISEVDIQTLYENNNRETHFNAIKDSLEIYSVMFKQFGSYIFSSLLSLVIDILSFAIFFSFACGLMNHSIAIFSSTVVSRVISSIVNYTINKNIVFKTKEKHTMLRYYILWLIQMFSSAILTTTLSNIFWMNILFVKMIVDFILFCISFQIQKNIIFK